MPDRADGAVPLALAGLLTAALPASVMLGAQDPTIAWATPVRPVGGPSDARAAVALGVVFTPSPAATPAPVATATPPPPARATPAAASAAEAACAGLWVRTTDGSGVGLRQSPALADRGGTLITEGTRVDDLCGDVRADGTTWRRVRTASGAVGYVSSDYLATSPPPAPTAAAPDPTDPFTQWGGLFVGTWDGHGRTLVVRPNGNARYEWRTYRDCAREPQPCDVGVQYGGWADIRFEHASASLTAGRVVASNDPAVLPVGTVRLTRRDDGTADLRSPGRPPTILCGAEYAAAVQAGRARPGACGA